MLVLLLLATIAVTLILLTLRAYQVDINWEAILFKARRVALVLFVVIALLHWWVGGL